MSYSDVEVSVLLGRLGEVSRMSEDTQKERDRLLGVKGEVKKYIKSYRFEDTNTRLNLGISPRTVSNKRF